MGLRQSKIVLCAANNAKIDVQGVADAKVSALSPNGECYETSTKIYVVHNVNEVYLSLDILVGLKIVNEFFPTAGAGNQAPRREAKGTAPEAPWRAVKTGEPLHTQVRDMRHTRHGFTTKRRAREPPPP